MKNCASMRGDGVAIIKRRRQDLHRDDVRDPSTASGRVRLKEDLESSKSELSGEEAWEAIEIFAQGQKEWDNPSNIISEQEVANLKAQAKRLFRNENVWVEMHRGIAWDMVENSNPQYPIVLLSFEEN
uniref:Uncharacterized protein n=1 Tax=Tanacetum cinerariifolium TaxID=118510 RepID=A0A6L2NN69_TANCI|nr:hypothetical protein [Tanacetum cinerariifolium]